MDAHRVILHLSLITGVGPATIAKIIASCGNLLKQVYDFSVDDFMQRCGLSYNSAQLLVHGLRDWVLYDRESELLERHGFGLTTIIDHDYPSMLKEIYAPPSVLYWTGKHPADHERMIALVGSREANSYGKKVVDYIVPEVVANGWAVVSGGALGIDSFAHKAALNASGSTLVVLGSGLCKRYPSNNERLFDEISARGGTILSSFALEQEAQPGNFPARNRIIAGLASGTVVVQAALKSGALITAQFALEQGREVFAVPGPIFEPLSEGCHLLLKQGARLVHSAADIIEEFGQTLQKRPKEVAQQPLYEPSNSVEKVLIEQCQEPVSVDNLLMSTGIALADLQQHLFTLQLQGVLTQDHAGMWQKAS